MTTHDVMAVLQAQIVQHGSQQRTARALGISAQYLTDVLQGRRPPAGKLLRALGLQRQITFTVLGSPPEEPTP